MLLGKELALEEVPSLFVVVLGIGTVFVGLVCLIVLCKIISAFCAKKSAESVKPAVAPAPAAPAVIENKQEILAAISAVVAEELGKDVSAIKITSFKKL